MREEKCEILLRYLRSILYDSKIEAVDLDELSGSYRELGMELQVLHQVVERIKRDSEVLMDGRAELHVTAERTCGVEIHRTRGAEQIAFAHIFTDMAKEWEEKEKLTSKAYHDALTGIQSRLYFEEAMAQVLAQGMYFTLCYIDLDHLKQVNDEYGHREGDAYIRRFTEQVHARIREYDLFARIGGDEFCVVFLECHEEVAARKMAWILDEFEQNPANTYDSSFSYGLIEVDSSEEESSLDEILSHADARMYEMKREHKARAAAKNA